MGVHIAQIGVGRVGRPTAYTILSAGLASEITVCDIKKGLATAFAEELRHVAASLRLDVEIHDSERDDDVSGADVILVSAGMPRTPGAAMTRRDLAAKNAKVIKEIAETTASNNHGAKYVVITNPVDAMAMICKKYSKADFVIGTGTNLESLRFRSDLSTKLKVPVSKIQGWIGGEHGQSMVALWSTTRVYGKPIEDYSFEKKNVETNLAEMTEFIVDNIGATEYGPAASFRDIVRAIVNNTDEILSVDIPMEFSSLSELTYVSIPVRMGWILGPNLYSFLNDIEKQRLENAAMMIRQIYGDAINSLRDA